MAMVVKNNMSAVKTLNTLNKNSAALQKSLAKVSSGMKINSAQDDASGYAISERMRVQIRSLDQANQNTQNASSLMKTAEGAVSSTVEILKSLKEKAINAATDTNTDADRATIQKELDQFIDQIDDNALTTFNGKYLVDGSKGQSGVAVATAFTNQSLDENTNGSTKLTELANRNGESLEIESTDFLTASFVSNGETYTTYYKVKDTTLEQVFQNLNKLGGGSAAQEDPAVTTARTEMNDALTALGTQYTSFVNANLTNAAGFPTEASNVKAYVQSLKSGDNYTQASASDMVTYATALGGNAAAYAFWASTSAGNDTAGSFINPMNAYNTALSTYNSKVTAYNNAVAASGGGGGSSAGSGVFGPAKLDDAGSDLVYKGTDIGISSSSDKVSTADGTSGVTVTAAVEGVRGQISGLTLSITDSEGNVKKSANAALDDFKMTIYAKNESKNNELTFQVGAKANQSITVGLDDMRAEALGLKGDSGTKVSVATQDKANAAVSVFDNAIQKALDQQATIGAIEARLEYTSQNLTTSSENVQAAESTIRDADMAKEMTNYTKNNVLLQAAQSMLAQANQNSSAVLSLLQ